jgi:hypothetical protein
MCSTAQQRPEESLQQSVNSLNLVKNDELTMHKLEKKTWKETPHVTFQIDLGKPSSGINMRMSDACRVGVRWKQTNGARTRKRWTLQTALFSLVGRTHQPAVSQSHLGFQHCYEKYE